MTGEHLEGDVKFAIVVRVSLMDSTKTFSYLPAVVAIRSTSACNLSASSRYNLAVMFTSDFTKGCRKNRRVGGH